jgi:hypothetical protein
VRRNLYLALIDEMNNVPQRIAHTSIIEEADHCVNESALIVKTRKGGA